MKKLISFAAVFMLFIACSGSITIGGTDKVTVYLVALDDNGKTGKKIGCGDSLVGVERSVPKSSEPVEASLHELFSIKDHQFGSTGLYNALYDSSLSVDEVIEGKGKFTNNRVTQVKLSGTLSLKGTCEDARMEAQIVETVSNVAYDGKYEIFYKGELLREAFSTA